MASPTITPDALKKAMKEALVETLTEQRELFAGVMAEALEEVALTEAIKEGQQTETVSRTDIFELLNQ